MTNNKTNNVFYNCILVMCIAMLAGCGGDNKELEKYITDVKSRPLKPVEPLPAFTPVSPFRYPTGISRRDPFKQISVAQKLSGFEPNQNRAKQPLEFFPLDSLKFVGMLKQGGSVWGLIAEPNGQVTRISPGDYMGQNYGRVLSIKENGIKLEEVIRSQGKWEKKFITLNLNVEQK
jgi:type IV pilus assembly protein PilP